MKPYSNNQRHINFTNQYQIEEKKYKYKYNFKKIQTCSNKTVFVIKLLLAHRNSRNVFTWKLACVTKHLSQTCHCVSTLQYAGLVCSEILQGLCFLLWFWDKVPPFRKWRH